MLRELMDATPSRWEEMLTPLLDSYASLLPPDASLSVDAPARTVSISWMGTPGLFALTSLTSDFLSKGSNYWNTHDDQEVIAWPGLTLRLTHRIPSSAYGFAFLMASLAAPCPSCPSHPAFQESHDAIFAEHLASAETPSSSHPLLAPLAALGADVPSFVAASELLPALASSLSYQDLASAFHKADHLSGLLALDAALKSS